MIEVRRAADRFRTVATGLDSRHSFSYGRHYDPDNLGFGVLMAHNEDRLAPGVGYDRHSHRGLDIVTWVLSGTLEHEHWTNGDRADGDAAVRTEWLSAGMAQVLRTGSGVDHAEHAAADNGGVHYVQMWLASGTPAEPGYDRADFTAALTAAGTTEPPGWVTVARGRAEISAALTLSQPGADLSVARLSGGAEIVLPEAQRVHVFIARGLTSVDGTQVAAGDALRLQANPAQTLTAVEPSEVLVWTLP